MKLVESGSSEPLRLTIGGLSLMRKMETRMEQERFSAWLVTMTTIVLGMAEGSSAVFTKVRVWKRD